MPEQDGFERRFAAAYREYLDDAPELEVAELARSIALAHPRRRLDRFAGPWFSPQFAGAAWLLVALALLTGLVVGSIAVGSLHWQPGPWGLAKPGLIAFDTKGGHVLIAGPDGSDPRDISSSAGGDHLPVWSPDGAHLALWRATGDHFSLVVTDAEGTVTTTIPTEVAVPADPAAVYAGGAPGPLAWAPDSRRFAGWVWDHGIPMTFIASIDDGKLRLVGDPKYPAVDPAWSPDGSQIVFAGVGAFFPEANPAPDSLGLFVMNADGSGVHRIAHMDAQLTESNFMVFRQPQWQPGGHLIAYHNAPDGVAFHVFVVRPDGTGERDISLQVGGPIVDDAWPTWSPDGTRLAFTRRGISGYQAVIVDADGSHAVMPAHPPATGAQLTWSPDGTRILGLATDPSTGTNSLIVDIDVAGKRAARTYPIPFDQVPGWQRLTP